MSSSAIPPITETIPPLFLGSSPFNHQYNPDPHALPTTAIITTALASGISGLDTSPYYGPAELLIGAALSTPEVTTKYPRERIFISTKCGRIPGKEGNVFDYSPAWIRRSVERSIKRLNLSSFKSEAQFAAESDPDSKVDPNTYPSTEYVDLVYCHDVEFVSDTEVLEAITALRGLRQEGKLRYVGISGYPLDKLVHLAEMVKAQTGEPLDAVMSYANYTLQNTTLLDKAVPKLEAAGVKVITNGSPLGMGLLRKEGVPVGSMGAWHPAPEGLRAACAKASDVAEKEGWTLANLANRFAFESWLEKGARVGTHVAPEASVAPRDEMMEGVMVRSEGEGRKYGVTVCGCSQVKEILDTMELWRDIILADSGNKVQVEKKQGVQKLAERLQKEVFGEWKDVGWDSPGEGFTRGVHRLEDEESDEKWGKK
ncbi:Aldo/keto reductase [Ascobolus immersus RN42]|uniref:Aldo/keto reductase n=1 Tax=Ascobolus immersus RN42 TaxID=1160509 RepID=A0A3N4HC73_ASCIM|nr:Aldo/keto reductase [Ascobolus immersus RN42]